MNFKCAYLSAQPLCVQQWNNINMIVGFCCSYCVVMTIISPLRFIWCNFEVRFHFLLVRRFVSSASHLLSDLFSLLFVSAAYLLCSLLNSLSRGCNKPVVSC